MREKLNDNPVMQMVVIGALIVLVGFFFMTRMKGQGGSTAPATDPAATATAPAATDPVTGAPVDPEAAVPVDPAATGAVPTAAPPISGTAETPFKPGPGLPKQVVSAYDGGNLVAVLVTKQRGVDDKQMRHAIDAIRGKADVALFTTRVHDIADYSRIAQGVDLDRVPALVVIEPKKLVKNGNSPTATITYGFQSPQSVAQSVQDQLRDYKDRGYTPG